MWLPLSLLSCSWFLAPDPLELPAPTDAPHRPAAQASDVGFSFARGANSGIFELPPSNRPDGAPAPDRIPVPGPWTSHKGEKGQRVYKTPTPVRSNLLATATHGTHFMGTYPPPGLEVRVNDADIPFRRFGRAMKPRTVWGFNREELMVGIPDGIAPPTTDSVSIVFPKATAAENALNFATANMSKAEFVVRTLTIGDRSHTGLFMPAPASASWTVDIPMTAKLGLRATVVPPAVASTIASDGATVHVDILADGQQTEAGSISVTPDGWTPMRVDLAPWAGQTVEVRFRTEVGSENHALFDYVLLEAPTIYVPTEHPRRFLLVFVDTLRPDHLGLYGYDRPTSPNIDLWARHAVRFTQARSVAPWTLPSARAMLTGRQPEFFYEAPGLPERFSRAGWRTDAFVTNAFLSQPFDVHRGWDQFDYIHLDEASHVVEQAVEAMDAWPDRDSLVMIHLMEPHLPYREDYYHKSLFSDGRPDGLKYLSRKFLSDVTPEHPEFAEIRDYVIARYDQNIRAVDDALAPLWTAAGPDATTVFVSDHGEEFWDHGEFEHGHSFYDELLHIPLVIRSPHLPPGTVDAPVSLLDVAPTLLDLAGLSSPDTNTVPTADDANPGQGRSLVPIAWDDKGAIEALAGRPQAFGRPLYGPEGWGVLTGGRKYWEREGHRVLHSLDADPLERLNMAAPDGDDRPYHDALGQALDRSVRRTWRVELLFSRSADDEEQPEPSARVFHFSHPEGIEHARTLYDPRGRLSHATPVVDTTQVTMTIPPDLRTPEQLILYPTEPEANVEGLTVTVGDVVVTCGPRRSADIACVAGDAAHRIIVREGWSPEPGGVEVSGYDPRMAQQLEELGYTDDE